MSNIYSTNYNNNNNNNNNPTSISGDPNNQNSDNKEETTPTNRTPNNLFDALLILLGFSNYKINDASISFNIHFASVQGLVLGKNLMFTLDVSDDDSTTQKETLQVNCTRSEDKNNKVSYTCTNIYPISIQNIKNINKIKVNQDWKFDNPEVKVVSMTPIAKSEIENIQEINDNIDLLNSVLYILEHCKIDYNGNMEFNITGTITGQKPDINNSGIKLKVSVGGDDDKKEAELQCSFVEIIGDSFTMNCKGDEEHEYDFQGSMSIDRNIMIVLLFDEDTNSKIIAYPSDIQDISYAPNKGMSVRRNNNDKICNSKCVIIVAILVPLTLISAIISVIVLRKKMMKKKLAESDSTVINLNKI